MPSCTSKFLTLTAVATLCAWPVFGQGAYPPADQKLPPLVLAKRGIFFTGGQIVTRTDPAGTTNQILVGQAYVEYSIPENKRENAIPIILMHAQIGGTIWQTTPDGREGWYDFFVRHGFPVYVIDPPGTGRAGFNVDPYNLVQQGLASPSSQPGLYQRDSHWWIDESAGPAFGSHGPVDSTCVGNNNTGPSPQRCYGWQMPNDPESLKHWLAHGIPMPLPSLPSPAQTAPYLELLHKIGPAIWIGWSGGGLVGGSIAQSNPELFKGLIGIEPANNCLFDTSSPPAGSAQVPALSIHGITQIGRVHEPAVKEPPPGSPEGFTAARNSRADCEVYYAQVKRSGGDVGYLSLYESGIYGNSHMMFWEKNSDQIAQLALDWIEQHVEKKQKKE